MLHFGDNITHTIKSIAGIDFKSQDYKNQEDQRGYENLLPRQGSELEISDQAEQNLSTVVQHSVNYTVTFLLVALDVNAARWRFVSSQIDHARGSCNNTIIQFSCMVYSNNKTFITSQHATTTKSSPLSQQQLCSFEFVPQKSPTYQIVSIPTSTTFDYIGLMMSDTNLRPHGTAAGTTPRPAAG